MVANRVKGTRSQWTALLMSVLFTTSSALAASLSDISFSQVDWYDDNDNLVVPSSSWGHIEMDIIPDAVSTFYLNVVGNAGSSDAWLVQNMPIFPASVGEDTRQQVDFDITDLGVAEGTGLFGMDVHVTLDATPAGAMPVGAMSAVAVGAAERRATGDKLTTFPTTIGKPAAHKAQGAATDVIQHKGVDGVQEGKQRCLPGAFARSLKWLDDEFSLGHNKSAQDIFDDLRALDIGSMAGDAKVTTYEQDIVAKQKYFKGIDNRAETKVLDLAGIVGNVAGATDVTLGQGETLLTWMRSELATEDVELHYANHIITVTGMFKQDGKEYIKYRDDEHQGDDTKGDTAEKKALISMNGNKWVFRADGSNTDFEIKVAISESIPEPATFILLTFGLALLTRRRAW